MNTLLSLLLITLLIGNCAVTSAKTSPIIFDTGVLFSYTGIDDTTLNGSLQSELSLYSDSFPSQDSDNSEDLVSSVYVGVGKYWNEWLIKAYYEYRYRFDINGHVGGSAKLAHIRTNVNTQRFMISLERTFLEKGRWQWDASLAAGLAVHRIDLRSFDGNEDYTLRHEDSSFTWHAKTGVKYRWSRELGLALEFQYTALGGIAFGPQFNGVAINIESYNGLDVILGARYSF